MDSLIAAAARDLRGSPRTLAAASATLEARADRANALQARLIAVRRLLLLGRLDEAASALARLDARGLPPSLLAVAAGGARRPSGPVCVTSSSRRRCSQYSITSTVGSEFLFEGCSPTSQK
jgi:hypothetical protein